MYLSLKKGAKALTILAFLALFTTSAQSQTTLLEESFENSTGQYIDATFDSGCDFFKRDNSPPANGCHSETITGLDGSFMWATEDMATERILEFLPINSTGATGIQFTFKAGVSRFGQQRWDWEDRLFIEYNMDDAGWEIAGLIMGGGVAQTNSAIGEMAIDIDNDPLTNGPGSFIPGSEVTLNMTDITFDIPATGNSLKVRFRMDQDGGSEEMGLDHVRVTASVSATGCTNSVACNYDSSAAVDDGSCILATGCDVCDGAGGITDNPEIGDACDDSDPTTGNDMYIACGICQGTLLEGCMDTTACNYDSNALADDGSCVYPNGCDDPTACNYDSTANCDDGSCIYNIQDACGPGTIWDTATQRCIVDPTNNPCLGDFNQDGDITALDLTGFLDAFGNTCP